MTSVQVNHNKRTGHTKTTHSWAIFPTIGSVNDMARKKKSDTLCFLDDGAFYIHSKKTVFILLVTLYLALLDVFAHLIFLNHRQSIFIFTEVISTAVGFEPTD